MATQLTIVAVSLRKGFKFGIYFIVFLVIARLMFLSGLRAYRRAVPPKTPPPSSGFGTLPALQFPDLDIELPELEFRIQTAEGVLPTFSDRMPVYAMPRFSSGFFLPDEMRAKASVFGFNREPIQLSERVYRFNHPNVPSTMEIDIISSVFSISFNLAADPTPLEFRSPTVSRAKDIIESRLENADLYPEDLENGRTENVFLEVQGQNLVRAASLSEAELVQVNMFRNGFGENNTQFPTVTADPNQSNVWFIVSGHDQSSKQIIAGEYNYYPVDRGLSETYAIKNAEQALEELVSGGGYVSNLGLNVDGNIVIRRIYLAYYDPNEPSEFMQPVFVFEGDDGFLAYVPAVKNEFIKSKDFIAP